MSSAIRLATIVSFAVLGSACAAEPSAAELQHFENKVRPILVEHCYSCHSDQSKKGPKGSLRVDSRKALLEGGDNGAALVPGDVEKSRLIEAVRYKNADLLMPPKGKIPDSAIRDLETWVKAGAPWPNEMATASVKSEFDLAQRKAEHWAWQPLAKPKLSTVDDYLKEKLKAKGLAYAAPASKTTWLRRVSFALIGLPPTPEEIDDFDRDTSAKAFEKVVDRLLASPHYGERWGRHWLDLVRYAESRGHEFEPDIPNAFRYRDSVIRSWNADVAYDRWALEHLAGDALPDPRYDPQTGANESLLATGFWHLGEEVHSPVDIRQDQADRFDNRIDVATKTFLGLTVSCARCHDHKFDAISTKDYYSLFGLIEGASYRQARVDGGRENRAVAKELEIVRQEFHSKFADRAKPLPAKTTSQFDEWRGRAKTVLDYSALKPGEWLPDDVSFGEGPRAAGSIRPRRNGAMAEPYAAAVFDRFWAGLKSAPNTAHDYGDLGKRQRAGFGLRTPSFLLEKKRIHLLVRGGGTSYAAVGQHAIIGGPLHAALIHNFNEDNYRWVAHDLSAYVGQRLHLEFTADPKTEFALALIVQADDNPPSLPAPAFDAKPFTIPDGLDSFEKREGALRGQVKWESGTAPAMWDGPAVDSPVFIRGNPRTPGPIAPHRSLEALAGPDKIEHATGSGRLEVAKQWIDPKRDPLFARVAVNRVWHHLFGRGLVPSTDNFGVLGEKPSHPELLDFLAIRFAEVQGWKFKALIRELVLTEAYRTDSVSNAEADKLDPTDELLHKFRLHRLEGESIRDAMLQVSGRLDRTPFGPSVPIHLSAFLDGRGKPGVSGPVDGQGRRSIYLSVRRNFLNPFFLAFDTPIPFSTVGKRQVSNVPAQALILLNDPLGHELATLWAKATLAKPGTPSERIARMYRGAFGRTPTELETKNCLEFLKDKETDPKAWGELAHALFNVKEFLYVR